MSKQVQVGAGERKRTAGMFWTVVMGRSCSSLPVSWFTWPRRTFCAIGNNRSCSQWCEQGRRLVCAVPLPLSLAKGTVPQGAQQ